MESDGSVEIPQAGIPDEAAAGSLISGENELNLSADIAA